MFESAVVDTVVFLAKTKQPSLPEHFIDFTDNLGSRKKVAMSSIVSTSGSKIVYRYSDTNKKDLTQKIINKSIRFGDVINIKAGVKLYERGKGNPPQDDKTMKEKPFTQKGKQPKGWKQLLRGANIDRYLIKESNEFVLYGEWLAAPRPSQIFSAPNIIIRRTDDKIKAAYNSSGAICVNSCHVVKANDESQQILMVALLNSRLLQWIFEIQNPQMIGKAFAEIKVVYVENLPYRKADHNQLKEFSSLVNQILAAKAASATANTTVLERQVDALVYKLYDLTDEEIALVEGRSA